MVGMEGPVVTEEKIMLRNIVLDVGWTKSLYALISPDESIDIDFHFCFQGLNRFSRKQVGGLEHSGVIHDDFNVACNFGRCFCRCTGELFVVE